jgi:glycosyltransferase involved in cell wall biosynthesis
MRILHVIPSLAPRDGGPAKAAVEMCRALKRRGEYVEIYTTNADGDGCLSVPLERATEVRGISVTYFPINGGHYYKLSRTLAGALRKNVRKFDILHIDSLYQFPSTIAAHYSRKFGVPYILRPHGTLDPYLYRRHTLRKRVYEGLVERRNLSDAAAVHFTSTEEMELAKTLGLRLKAVVVPLGMEQEEGLPMELADEIWPQLSGKQVVLFLGRINFKKGLDILARAMGEICRRRSDVHLVIAGPDNDGYIHSVRKWLAEEGVLAATTFTGFVLGGRKAALLKRADLFVLSSYSENFGFAVVEAMGAGLPVVISNKVNIWREIDAAGAGLVVNTEPGEVATAITRLLDNPRLAHEIGVRGSWLARKRFSWESAGLRLLELYTKSVSEALLSKPTKVLC